MTSPITHEKIIEVLREALVDLCDAWEHNGGKFDGNITKSTATGRIALETASDLYQRLQAEKEGGWQPIETAPKDGTPILAWMLWYPHGLHGREEYAERNFDILRWTDFNGGGWVHYMLGVPTHWRHLPDPPLNQEGGDAANPVMTATREELEDALDLPRGSLDRDVPPPASANAGTGRATLVDRLRSAVTASGGVDTSAELLLEAATAIEVMARDWQNARTLYRLALASEHQRGQALDQNVGEHGG